MLLLILAMLAAAGYILAKRKTPKAIEIAGYHPQASRHPVDCIDDTSMAVASLLVATLAQELECPRKVEQSVKYAVMRMFGLETDRAEQLTEFGRWVIAQGDLEETLRKLTRRVAQLGGRSRLSETSDILHDLCGPDRKMSEDTVQILTRMRAMPI